LRRAQAWQNRALCLWGLGRLPEALPWFERSLTDIGPEPYPSIFLASITNTALADYALGTSTSRCVFMIARLPLAKGSVPAR